MATLADMETRYEVRMLEHLARDADIPTVTRLAAQGDVLIVACDAKPAVTPIPAAGVPVVRGEGGNTHSLHGVGFFDRHESGQTVGVLTIPDGGEAFLLHPEHGGFAVAAGTYELRRQREQADEIRLVAD